MLKKWSIFFWMFLACTSFGFTNEEACNHEESSSGISIEDKFYLHPGMLHMDEKGLYVNIEGTLFAVNRILADERGIYIEEKIWDVWYCKKNGHPNPPWTIVCGFPDCNSPR